MKDKVRNIVLRLNDKMFDMLNEAILLPEEFRGFTYVEDSVLEGILLGDEVIWNSDNGDADDMLKCIDDKIKEWTVAKQIVSQVLTKEDKSCLNGELE